MNFENVNFEEQYERMEMDMAWDKYLNECQIMNISPMSFAQWKKCYLY